MVKRTLDMASMQTVIDVLKKVHHDLEKITSDINVKIQMGVEFDWGNVFLLFSVSERF